MVVFISKRIKKYCLVVAILLLVLDETVGRGRGGGSRGGSRSRGGRGGYFSSPSSRYYSGSRGSRLSSTYISLVPSTRYGRAYYSNRGPYYSYYSLYFYHSGTYIYLHRPRPSSDSYVCANYEANSTLNGTTMGIFSCPNTWEPSSFTYCCGVDYAEYCCEKGTDVGLIVGVASAVVIVVGGIIYLLGSLIHSGAIQCCKSSTENDTITPTEVAFSELATRRREDEPQTTTTTITGDMDNDMTTDSWPVDNHTTPVDAQMTTDTSCDPPAYNVVTQNPDVFTTPGSNQDDLPSYPGGMYTRTDPDGPPTAITS